MGGGCKKEPHSGLTGSPSSLIELCQQQPSHFSFHPVPLSRQRRIVCALAEEEKEEEEKSLVTTWRTIFNSDTLRLLVWFRDPHLRACRASFSKIDELEEWVEKSWAGSFQLIGSRSGV